MSYYQKIEKGLDEWVAALEEIESILKDQETLTQTFHFKYETCCSKVKKVLDEMRSVKEQ